MRLDGIARLASNLVASNVPGPQHTFYLDGTPLLEVFPAVPLNPRNQALSIGAVSYDGGVRFGLLTLGLDSLAESTATVMTLAVLLVLINIGYDISGWTVLDDERVLPWLLTSWYLTVTALFFAAMLADNTKARVEALTRGCVIAGVSCSLWPSLRKQTMSTTTSLLNSCR